ncbi:MAG: hypothetical protein DHS80DRAFT_14458 [Piptocephalis tieghemiana]|nr:MAG: hypothetical protein DHS80DRAFT_14458 [Piptocephalis tieghemiana]
MPSTALDDSDSEIDEAAFLDAEDDDIIEALSAPSARRSHQPRSTTHASSSSSPSPSSSTPPPPTVPQPQAADGVFANLSAGYIQEDQDKFTEDPPSYTEASQDIVPPYFQTTVITGLEDPDEILVEGLPAGSSMSFIWNMLISMAFQFVGFLLTFLLHTSHAAKNGSRAGLGITLINYGLYMQQPNYGQDGDYIFIPDDPPPGANDSSATPVTDDPPNMDDSSLLISYALVLLGWFLVVRSTTEYIRIRRMLAAYTISPESIVV